MKILKLTVGPIVGFTTSTTSRVFGRGEAKDNDKGHVRCHGIARFKERDSQEYSKPQVFKMNPIFDFTGVTEFYNLKPGKVYDFEVGFLFDEREPDEVLSEVAIEGVRDWSGASKGSFGTASEDPNSTINFVFGSCRYMLKLGKYLFDTRGDKVFRSMLGLIEDSNERLDHCMMLGDQIYADDLNFIGAAISMDQYNERYRVSFSQPHISRLMSQLSTYMILDDHEIEDNWPEKANEKDKQSKYPVALHAYQTYQVSHSPVMKMKEGKILESPDRYWYKFSNGCADFFVLDTRTERYLPEQESERVIINTRQMVALKNWLSDGSGKIKFVASGVPVFPDLEFGREDKWSGFLVQRTELLDFIKNNGIAKVVFLSGDVHSSLSAQIECRELGACKITSIISSSFFWPVPIYRSKNFQLSGSLKVIGASNFLVKSTSGVVSEDNFTLVKAKPEELSITVYNRKGRILAGPYKLSLI